MTARQRTQEQAQPLELHSPEPRAADAGAADRLSALEAEIARLRADNTAVREQLTLRDHALDATPSFFLITEQPATEPAIVYCNKVVAEHHGVARADLIGKTPDVLTQWGIRNKDYRVKVAATLLAGETFHYEDEVTRRDGSAYWVGISIRPLFDAAGNLTHSVAIGADITAKREESRKKQELQDKLLEEMNERQRMVMELQLAQKLESVGRLAAGVAHEINTPIQYVSDSVHFLRAAYDDLTGLLDGWRQAFDALPESAAREALALEMQRLAKQYDPDYIRAEVPQAFERTFHGLERVTNIVKAMKEFAHPDTDEQSPADLNHAIQTTLLVASNEYKYLAVVETDFAELPEVTCNIGEMNQVFLNLIVNAAHAIQEAGRDVGTGKITIRTELSGAFAVIRIGDNGCGISPENIPKVYDPFFTTKEVGRGTGQGLAISHSILVDKHGGDINVQSEVGLGTTFVLRLPIAGRTAEKVA
jgi:PAS domain S-box-containing protein